jgi:hypothetical protein
LIRVAPPAGNLRFSFSAPILSKNRLLISYTKWNHHFRSENLLRSLINPGNSQTWLDSLKKPSRTAN